MTETREYIGDGVYASFDGYGVWLYTEREDTTHRIYLEQPTLTALEAYLARARGER